MNGWLRALSVTTVLTAAVPLWADTIPAPQVKVWPVYVIALVLAALIVMVNAKSSKRGHRD